jgi:hypothetical protein
MLAAFPESPELFIAQAATYAEQALPETMDTIFRHLGRNSLKRLAAYLGDQPRELPEGVPAYRHWVATADEPTEEYVAANATALEAFAGFSEAFADLEGQLGGMPDKQAHPDYLGSGFVSHAYRLGPDHVVRTKRRGISAGKRAEEVNLYVASLLPGRDIERAEQLVAHTYHRGLTVAEFRPGKRMGLFRSEDVDAVTDPQIDAAFATIDELNLRGLRLDPKFGNVLYDRHKGFSILDYNAFWSENALQDSDALNFTRLLAYGGIYPCTVASEADFARLAAAEESRMPLIQRAQLQIARRYPHDRVLMEGVQQIVDESLARQAQFNDPRWVVQQVTRANQRRRPLKYNPVPRIMLDQF